MIVILPIPFSVLYFLNQLTKAGSSYSYRKHMVESKTFRDDEELKELIEAGKMKIILKVFCQSTKFRKIFEIIRK